MLSFFNQQGLVTSDYNCTDWKRSAETGRQWRRRVKKIGRLHIPCKLFYWNPAAKHFWCNIKL